MKYVLVSVYDSKAAEYQLPRGFKRVEMAERSFGLACADEQNDFNKYASDYSLFEVGVYDDDTGIAESLNAPRLIITAPQAKAKYTRYYESIPEDESHDTTVQDQLDLSVAS